MMFMAYERGTQFYPEGVKLPFRTLFGVTATKRKMQLLSSELSFLRGVTIAGRTSATHQQRAQAAVWYAERKLFVTAQRNSWRELGCYAYDTKTMKECFDKILATGNIPKQSVGTRWRVSEEKVEEIFSFFQRNPQ
jgi:hypothetical protein